MGIPRRKVTATPATSTQRGTSVISTIPRCWRVGGVESGQHLGIVLITEVPRWVEVAGVAVTFRRGMPIVQVRGHRRESKTGIVFLVYRGQPIDVARHLGNTVVGRIGWARAKDLQRAIRVLMNVVSEAPDGLRGKTLVACLAGGKLLLGKLVNPWRREREHADIQFRRLVTSGANLTAIRSGEGIRADGGSGVQRANCHGPRIGHDGEGIEKPGRVRTGSLVTGNAQVE